MGGRNGRAGFDPDKARKRRERKRRLIERFNQNDTHVPRGRDGHMSEQELEVEREKQWNYSRRGFGQMMGGGM